MEVVDSWSAVVDPRNHLWVDPNLSNDGTHFVMGNNEGNERIVGELAMRLIQEQLEYNLEPIVTIRNARSLDARRQAEIERTQQEILAAIPTTDADGFVTVATNNDKTGYGLTAATMATLFDDSDAQTQLTDFLDGLAERFDDDEDIAPTVIVQAILSNPQIMQLIVDAQAARVAAEANGTVLATPNNFKADTVALQAAIDTVLTELANTLKVDEDLTFTNAAENGSDTVRITR